jgi:inositol polyphosphate-4-phosphatase
VFGTYLEALSFSIVILIAPFHLHQSFANSIVRKMNGAHVICCKSAKDRTSMSTTWHNAMFVQHMHLLSISNTKLFTDLSRIEGVRRTNVLKNVGKPLYAFNAFQQSMLPVEFQPAPFCCGKVDS